MEQRFTSGECRIETREGNESVAIGYGSVFYRSGEAGTEYPLWEGAVERIDRDAFTQALSRPDDVRALFNHESDHLLGRLAANTLRLSVDDTGLRYEIDLPDTQIGRQVKIAIERGDLTGSSFAFVPEVVQWDDEGETEVRTIKSVRLFDVGPVTYPAYGAASTGLRTDGNVDDSRAERDAWKDSQAMDRKQQFSREIKARMLELDIK